MTQAEQIEAETAGRMAWNFTPQERKAIVRRAINQHGTRYTFDDGSALWVQRGMAAAVAIRKG